MRAIQKLVKNGNATAVSIPRAILAYLGWIPGERMMMEVLEDNSIRVRRLVAEDFGPKIASGVLYDTPMLKAR